MLMKWLFRSQLSEPFQFDTDVWKYAKLADKFDIPLLRTEVEHYYLRCWPPGCNDMASQFVVFNEACRYHLDGIRDLYYVQVEMNVVAFFTAGVSPLFLAMIAHRRDGETRANATVQDTLPSSWISTVVLHNDLQ